jgi:hypothetical protein
VSLGRVPGASRDNKVTPHSLLGDPPSLGRQDVQWGVRTKMGKY